MYLARMAGLDRSLQLFENMYHAGPHAVTRAGEISREGQVKPLILHFNGPAKVVFETRWGLPWDSTAGKTPVLLLIEGMRKTRSSTQRRAATAAFEHNVTFLDPWLRKAPTIGPLRYSCDVPI